MKIYLAGPDVFLPDARAVGARKKETCRARGVEGLFPLDAAVSPDDPRAIFEACMEMVHSADAGLFNLTPFRGIDADPGTAFEMGAMHVLGRPVAGYTAEERDLASRIRTDFGPVREGTIGEVDRDGMLIEDFGASDNAMLAFAGPVAVCAPVAQPSLAAFEAFDLALDRLLSTVGGDQ